MKFYIIALLFAAALAVGSTAQTTVPLPSVRNGQLQNGAPPPLPAPRYPQLYGAGNSVGVQVPIGGGAINGGATVAPNGKILGGHGGVTITLGK